MSAIDMQSRQFSHVNAAVATSLVDVGDPIELDGNFKEVCFEVENTGANMSDFSLMIKAHPLGTYVNWITGTAWAAAVGGLLRYKSADLNTLANAGKATVVVYLPCCSHIKFQAKCGTSTSVTVRGTAWR